MIFFVLVFLLVTNQIAAMDNTKGLLALMARYQKVCIDDKLIDQYPVAWYRLQNMKFPVEPADLAGKDILTALSISQDDQKNLALAFHRADEGGKVEESVYTLNQKQYLTKVAVFRASEKKFTKNRLFYVEIEEAIVL